MPFRTSAFVGASAPLASRARAPLNAPVKRASAASMFCLYSARSRAPRAAAHSFRGRVVNFAAQDALALSSLLSHPSEITPHPAHVLSGRDARQQFRARTETRVAHPQRLVDVFARELVERHARGASDYFAERDEVDVAVDEAQAGRASERLIVESLQHFVVARPLLAQIEVGRVAGAVREKVFDCYLLAPLAFEFGDVE